MTKEKNAIHLMLCGLSLICMLPSGLLNAAAADFQAAAMIRINAAGGNIAYLSTRFNRPGYYFKVEGDWYASADEAYAKLKSRAQLGRSGDLADHQMYAIMKDVLEAKFQSSQDLVNILLSTGDAQLINDTDDSFFGWGPSHQATFYNNVVGRLLMTIRAQLREHANITQTGQAPFAHSVRQPVPAPEPSAPLWQPQPAPATPVVQPSQSELPARDTPEELEIDLATQVSLGLINLNPAQAKEILGGSASASIRDHCAPRRSAAVPSKVHPTQQMQQPNGELDLREELIMDMTRQLSMGIINQQRFNEICGDIANSYHQPAPAVRSTTAPAQPAPAPRSAVAPKAPGNVAAKEICGICQEEFDRKEMIDPSNCSHLFCKQCLLKYTSEKRKENFEERDDAVSTVTLINNVCPVCRKPIDERKIASLKASSTTSKQQQVRCAICQDEPDDGVAASMKALPCMHMFHSGCLISYYRSMGNPDDMNQELPCPACLHPFTLNDLLS